MCTFLDCKSSSIGLLFNFIHLAKIALAQNAHLAKALLEALEFEILFGRATQ